MAENDDPDFKMPAGLRMLPVDKPKAKPPKVTPPERPRAKPKEKPAPKEKAKKPAKPKPEPKKKSKAKPKEKAAEPTETKSEVLEDMAAIATEAIKGGDQALIDAVPKLVEEAKKVEATVQESPFPVSVQVPAPPEVLEQMEKPLNVSMSSESLTKLAAKSAEGEKADGIVVEVDSPRKKTRRLLIVDAEPTPEEVEDVAILGFKDGKRQIVGWTKLPKSKVEAFKARGSRADDPLLKTPTP